MIDLTPKQNEAVTAIMSGYRYVLTGGAISTAKTYGLALIMLSMAYQWPKTRYAVCRLNLTTIKKTTLQTFREVAEKMDIVYKENLTDYVWNFHNGSQIWFIELDHTKDRDFNKIKGMELTAAAIDECNEVTEQAFYILSSRVGRQNYNKEPQFILLTCNPSDTWVKSLFYDKFVDKTLEKPYAFIPSLPGDNPFNSEEYLAALESMPMPFKKRYVYGLWDYRDDENSLFKYKYFQAALVSMFDTQAIRYAGNDVARSGTDRSVIAYWAGNTLVDIVITKTKEERKTTDEQAMELIKFMTENSVLAQNVAVDAVGIGVGVIDHARSKGISVQEFLSGGKPTDDRFEDLRSQVIWMFADGLEKGNFKIFEGCAFRNELISEAMAHLTEINSKKLKIESKEKVKERTGSLSPDIFDAVIMALYPQLKINSQNDTNSIIF